MVVPITETDVFNTLELIRITVSKIESEIVNENFDLVDDYLNKTILYCNEIKHYYAPDDNDNSLELSQWQIDDIPF